MACLTQGWHMLTYQTLASEGVIRVLVRPQEGIAAVARVVVSE